MRFDAPLNVTATAQKEHFEVAAEFASNAKRCVCKCCEYRQFVRGTFTDANGQPVRFDMPSGPLFTTAWCEDGRIDEFGAGRHGFYGHRDTSSPGDDYGGSSLQQDCDYAANETVACPTADTAHLEFIGLVVDRCRRVVVAKKAWTIDL
jgi:hypothetical protein